MSQTNELSLPTDIRFFEPEEIDKYCKTKGKLFATGGKNNKKVSTSKLRNFFAKVISLRTYYRNPGKDDLPTFYKKLKREIILLKPSLAYAYGRDNHLENFFNDTTAIIDLTIESFEKEYSSKNEEKKEEESFKFESLENFFAILEGFVAYHKFYGGKD